MIERLAAKLRDAERAHQPIPPIRHDVSDVSVELAYRIQWENVRQRMGGGQRPIGWKIGLTSAAVQRQLGVDQPDYGMLFDNIFGFYLYGLDLLLSELFTRVLRQ